MTKPKKVDYDVGYAKPPKDTQFRKGESGNPRGRPKGRQNSVTILNKVLNETVTITENNQRQTITKLEATVKQVVNKAMTGNTQSIRLLLANLVPLVDRHEAQQGVKRITPEEDLQILADLLRRTTQH